MRKPWRAPGSRYGACDIDSMPPPTATSRSPARTAWSIIPTARTLDAHTLLIVSEVTSIGIPASICAWRLGICPCAGLQHRAHHDVLDLLGRDVGALQRLADRYAAEMRGRERRQTPAQLADRRARAAQDHGSRHTASRLTCGRCTSQRPRTHRPPRAPTRSSSASSRTRGSPTITAASCRRWSTPARPSAGCASSRSRTPRASATSSPGWARARPSIPSGRGSPPRGSWRARRSSGPRRCAGRSRTTSPTRTSARSSRARCWRPTATASSRAATTTPAASSALVLSAHHDVGARRRAGRRRWPPRPTAPATSRTARRTCSRRPRWPSTRRGSRASRSRCMDGAAIEAAGMGAFACVAQGSYEDARLITHALRAGRRHRPAARASSARP